MRSGQVTVLVLLLALLGLSATLSVASRSLSDLKQVSYVDTGTKAFAGAEAGLQFALNDFTNTTSTATCPPGAPGTTSLFIDGIREITYSTCSSNSDFMSVHDVGQDEVVQLDFPPTNPNNVQTFDVLWNNNNAAAEVITVDGNDVVTRYIFNGQSILARSSSNSFSDSTAASGCLDANCNDAFFTGGSCAAGISYVNNMKLIRIRPIYGTTGVAICANGAGHSHAKLENQVYTITATATTTNGSKKTIQATRLSPTLPSIFDHAIFTRGNLIK